MKYFYSQRDYEQYRPKQSWRQRLLSRYKSRVIKETGIKHKPALRNPYKKESGHFTSLKYCSIIALLILWIGLLVYLPNFRINNFTVNGLNIIKNDEISDVISKQIFAHRWPIPSNNYFLVNLAKITKAIEDNFTVADVNIEKKFPNSLLITVEEKTPGVIYDNSYKYYLLDRRGEIVKDLKTVQPNEFSISTITPMLAMVASSTTSTVSSSVQLNHVPDYQNIKKEFGNLPLIYDGRNITSTNPNQNWLTDTLIKGVIEFDDQIKQRNLTVRYFYLDNPLGGVRAYLNGQWDVYFTPDENTITEQLDKLKTFIKINKPTEYVDLRYGDRIYWK